MAGYYNRVYGNLVPGKIAHVQDINLIQSNINDAIKALMNDLHDHSAFILGEQEDAFYLSPAPKRLGRYIDTLNLVSSGNEQWLSIRNNGYKQAIRKGKTSCYSVIVKLKNTYSHSVDATFELQDEDGLILKKTILTIPAHTESAEFEVIFNLDYIATAPGRSGPELEDPDVHFMKMKPHEQFVNMDETYNEPHSINNFSVGSTQLYLVVKPLNISVTDNATNGDESDVITDETFMILADKTGGYGRNLEITANGGNSYTTTTYDLHFKDVYATTNTYLCAGGMAIIDGEPIKCMDTHVSIDGASTFGNVRSIIYMNNYGHLNAINSPAFIEDREEKIPIDLPAATLPIGIITTYVNDTKTPDIEQDDTLLKTRPRSHHERLRRLEKEILYQRDITIPPRLKYVLSGSDIADEETSADTSAIIEDGKTQSVATENKIEPGDKYFLTTDSAGNYVLKSVDNNFINVPVILKGAQSVTDTDGKQKTGVELAKVVASTTDITIDEKTGIAKLKEDTTANVEGNTGLTDDEAKLTTMNPWDDDAKNRPASKDITPTEREFVVDKDKTGKNAWASEFPAMTFYTKDIFTLKSMSIPITKFKNMESVEFHIWTRQGPNNKTNTVWLVKRIFKSESFSLADTVEKDGYQVLDKPFTINIEDGLELKDHQYVIMVVGKPKSGQGSVYVETYKPEESKDFLIRYYGSADASHFLLKDRYQEVWYNSAIFKGEVKSYAKLGTMLSGEATFDQEEPIRSLSVTGKIEVPDGCTCKIYGNAGSEWVELIPDQATNITGGTSSFKWKVEMTGTGSATPSITYDSTLGYALKFNAIRKKADTGGFSDANQCITTQPFYPGEILKKYIGDDNLDTTSKFSNYEFLRIWASDAPSSKLICDVAGSNIRGVTKSITDANGNQALTVTTALSDTDAPKDDEFDIFSFYYADLTLHDFVQSSVDYSNYDEDVEYDEHNLRMKIQTDQAYNDNDVALYNVKDIKSNPNIVADHKPVGSENNNPFITLMPPEDNPGGVEIPSLDFNVAETETYTENQKLWVIDTPEGHSLDLTKYSGMKLNYNLSSGTAKDGDIAIQGLGLYISSAIEEECPTNDYDLTNESGLNQKVIKGTATLPDTLNMTEAEMIEKYYGYIIKVIEEYNDTLYTVYYQYIKQNDGTYKREQVHDLKSFSIFELPTLTVGTNNQVIVSIDSESEHFKNVKEIGLITLAHPSDETRKFQVARDCNLTCTSIKSIAQGYNIIFNGEDSKLTPKDETLNNKNSHYEITTYKTSSNTCCRIKLWYNNISDHGETIAYINNDSVTTNFKHLAIQLATDCWIPKHTLQVNLCADKNGVNPLFTLDVPTLNYVYYNPGDENDTLAAEERPTVNFSQIFKRIDDEYQIKSISISTSDKFRQYMNTIRGTTASQAEKYITIFVKNIILHEADTIPLMHPNIRMKLYGKSDTEEPLDSPLIRKIGCIIQYS